MGASTWILNSQNSTDAIDLESTAFGCVGVHNGVVTVCQYLDDLEVGQWSGPWDTESGIHIQTHPDTNPNSSWDMESGYYECTVDKGTNVITYTTTSQRPSTEETAAALKPKAEFDYKHKPLRSCSCG